MSANCTNEANAKRRKGEVASVVIDMSPYWDEFQRLRKENGFINVSARNASAAITDTLAPGMSSGAKASADAADDNEDIINAMLEETKGCAIMDSGASIMCSSTIAAEEIQMQRLNQGEPGQPTIHDSDRRFRLADGHYNDADKMVKQPITAGLLSGKTVSMHLIDRPGNDTSPLFSIDEMRRLRMVVDYEENKVMFKDNPDVWHTLPTTKKGLMMIPLTKEACERHGFVMPPPPPTAKKGLQRKRKRKAHLLLLAVVTGTRYVIRGLCCAAEGKAGSRLTTVKMVQTLLLSRKNHCHLPKESGSQKKIKSGTTT